MYKFEIKNRSSIFDGQLWGWKFMFSLLWVLNITWNPNLFISRAIPIFILPYCMFGKFLIGILGYICRDRELKISLKFKLNKVPLEGLVRKFNFQQANWFRKPSPLREFIDGKFYWINHHLFTVYSSRICCSKSIKWNEMKNWLKLARLEDQIPNSLTNIKIKDVTNE